MGVAKIALGLQDKIVLGNLDARRDWGFAGDYVKAMWLMLQMDEPQDFVIATGQTHSVREFLARAFKKINISDWEKYVLTNAKFMRPAEVDVLVGDFSKAKEILNWEPSVDFDELVDMMVSYDLELLSAKDRNK
jgi:GDPmannose 4,6-dehydratase